MDLLTNHVKSYAWGSFEAIAALQGRATPTAVPEAELWMGAHPSAPSGLTRGGVATTLDAVIGSDPERELGPEVAARFGGRLPFLLKVLAARTALSIQTHPTRPQAEAGFAADNARGLLAGDPTRTYVDDWPKPELLVALTPFEALAGFRDADDASAFLAELDIPALAPVLELLRTGGDASRSDALRFILTTPADQRDGLVAATLTAYARVGAADSPQAAAARALSRVAPDHPGDIGLVAAALLRYTVLAPGQAIYLAAGGLHAYLGGTGVEILANSDNVIRAGLTPKHVDVDGLLDVMDPRVRVELTGCIPADGGLRYETPAPEFALFRFETPRSAKLPNGGPRIVLVVSGTATLTRDDPATGTTSSLRVTAGKSVYLSATDRSVALSGTGTVFVASVGDLTTSLGPGDPAGSTV